MRQPPFLFLGDQQMKRFILFLGVFLIAAPVFAQEGEGGGFGGMFGMGDASRAPNAPPPDRLVQLRKILLDAKSPLTQDQEKSLSSMLEKDIKQYTSDLEKKYPEEVAIARAAGGPEGRGGRGGGRGGEGRPGGGGGAGRGGPGLPPNSPLLAEMNRINAELQTKVLAALKPDQQAAFKKHQNDEIRKAGGFAALKLNMDEAGTPLTSDQETQLKALYAEHDQQRRELLRQNPADAAKIDTQLNADLAPKLLRILNAGQKKTLLDAMKKQAPQL